MSWRYLLARGVWALLVLLGITAMTFCLTRLIPGDPARAAAGPEASAEAVETLRRSMGLDRPLAAQYASYLRDLASFSFGRSIQTQRPVREDLDAYLPATVELAAVVMIIYTGSAIAGGIVAAVHPGRPVDYAIRTLGIAGVGLAPFWLGMLLQLVFYRDLGWLPATGRLDPFVAPPARITGLYLLDGALTANWPAVWSAAGHLALPVAATVASRLGVGVKLTRTIMLEVLREEYIRTAHSKGLSALLVLYRHGLKNALIPIVTTLAMQFSALLGGTVIVEVVFSWPGIGRYAVGSINTLDFPAVMSVTVVLAVAFLATSVLVDLLYLWLDPRIKYA
jgi:peptide/nickel transport system permease protein